MDKKATVNEDVYSNFDINNKERRPMVKRNETVKIIFESLPAVIVERANGEQWPVNINKLTLK